MLMRATWNGAALAESDETIVVEGNQYFPIGSLSHEFVADSPEHTRCPWKDRASYFDVVVDRKVNPAAVWYYPKPPLARRIAGHVAFWRGVTVEAVGEPR